MSQPFDYWQKVSANFRAGEFLPPDAHEHHENPLELITPWMIRVAEAFRTQFGVTYINTWLWGGDSVGRGFRFNTGVTGGIGVSKSRHRYGLALDLVPKYVTAEDARLAIKASEYYWMQLGVARLEDDKSWVHLDAGLTIYIFKG